MGDATKIQWTDSTWNPVRGCSVVSPGCENCYAMSVAARFSGEGQPYERLAKFSSVKRLPQWTGKVRLVPEHLADPLRWTKPRRVFVNSMSDLFHEGLSNEEIAAVFGVMAAAPRHTFQVLTKRAKRLREWFAWVDTHAIRGGTIGPNRALGLAFASGLLFKLCGHDVPKSLMDSSVIDRSWPLPNVWIGVSAEDQQRADERIPELLRTPAAVRFVSYEPALGPVDFRSLPANCGEPIDGAVNQSDYVDALTGAGHHPQEPEERLNNFHRLNWIIVGGESGPRARPFDVAWARSVVEQCKAAGVACFVKQLGARPFHFREPSGAPDDGGGPEDLKIKSRKGGDPSEWPADIRVRQYPERSR